MRIAVDAMGGDFAPLAPIRGCIAAAKDREIEPVLVGNTRAIFACAQEAGLDLSGVTVVHAENAVGMSDPPLSVRTLPDNSMKVGMKLLVAGEVDAFVSAGSTGALQTAATLFARRSPGVLKSAIGTVLPMENPTLLLDCGANTSYTPEILRDYAVMGSVCMEALFGLEKPRVGLLNIGTEEQKGRADYPEAYRLLKEDEGLDFIGNVEANAVPFGACDVLVSDGFSGNVFLKSIEGMSAYLFKNLSGGDREAFDRLRASFDVSERGGAPLLGISAPVIKAHGSSGERAILGAIRQAQLFAESGLCGRIAEELAKRRTNDQTKGTRQ